MWIRFKNIILFDKNVITHSIQNNSIEDQLYKTKQNKTFIQHFHRIWFISLAKINKKVFQWKRKKKKLECMDASMCHVSD